MNTGQIGRISTNFSHLIMFGKDLNRVNVHKQEAVAEKSIQNFCHTKEKWVGILILFKSQRFLISPKSRYFAVFEVPVVKSMYPVV